jgi:hypothetical protein
MKIIARNTARYRMTKQGIIGVGPHTQVFGTGRIQESGVRIQFLEETGNELTTSGF